jgi:hypothetical protein
MKKTLLLIALLASAPVWAQPPMVFFPTAVGPGNQTPLNDGSVNPGNFENPIDYGLTGHNAGWAYDSFQGSNLGNQNAIIRMAPTLQGPGAFTAMLEDEDYIFHFEFQLSTAAPSASDILLFSKHSPPDIGQPSDGREDRMFSIWYVSGSVSNFSVRVGNAGVGWSIVAENLVAPLGEYIDFDVHYRSTTKEFDFYWESAYLGSAETGHGRYDLDFIQVESIKNASGGGSDPRTSIRNVRLGHIVGSIGLVQLSTVDVGEQDLFTFLSDSGLCYRVECSSNAMPTAWMPVGLTILGDGTQKYAYDPGGAISPGKAYRIRVLQ